MGPQREWFETDYYAALGVAPDASSKEVTKAFRRLARRHHPDAPGGDEERFKKISAAYDVVGDEQTRAAYDEARRLGPAGFGPSGGGFASGPGGFSIRVENLDDLGNLGGMFDGLFARMRGRGGSAAHGAPFASRGQDLETRIGLSFRDAVHGVTAEVSVPDRAAGRMRRVRTRIPAGVSDGARIRLSGQGAPGPSGGPSGDLYVTCDVAPDADFGRDGLHLTLAVPITYPEAVLGTDLKVCVYDGTTVTLRIPPGTTSGTTFRVADRGVATDKGTGDLLVTVRIAVPTQVSATQREALEALAEVTDLEQTGSGVPPRPGRAASAPSSAADRASAASAYDDHAADNAEPTEPIEPIGTTGQQNGTGEVRTRLRSTGA